jgi:hypothetical protein
MTRAAVSFFNVEGSPGSQNAFDTPGLYGHVSHEWALDRDVLSAVRVGGFVSYATWPTGTLTLNGAPIPGQGTDLKSSSKVGFDANLWFGPNVTPVHLIIVFAHGQDDEALIADATRNGSFNGGFIEVGYTPTLNTTVFGRYDAIRNHTQGVPTKPQDFGDKDAETIGLRRTFTFSHNDAYTLHAEFSTVETKLAAEDGSDLRNSALFLGVDFAF